MKTKKVLMYIFVALLSIIMLGMAIGSFFLGEPKYQITEGAIVVFALIAVLLVFDTVESLSVGNVLSLNKKIKEKDKEVERLNGENVQLRNQFFSMISNSFNSKASSQIIIDASKGFMIQQAEQNDIDKEREAAQEEHKEIPSATTTRYNRVKITHSMEQLLLAKFIEDNDVPKEQIQKDVKIASISAGIDPIIEKDIIFDAYLRRPIDEIFIEVSLINNPHSVMDYRLYFMISKIYHYARANQVKAKMILLVPIYSKEYIDTKPEWLRWGGPSAMLDRLKTIYAPAILNGLLDVVGIKVSLEDMKQIESLAIDT